MAEQEKEVIETTEVPDVVNTPDTEETEAAADSQPDTPDTDTEKKPETLTVTPTSLTMTPEALNALIDARVKAQSTATKTEDDEAAKLATMSDEEKRAYEYKKLTEELEAYKKKDIFSSMAKEAGKLLSESGIVPDDTVLAFVVKDTAEDTASAVKVFTELVNEKAAELTKKALSGTPPKKLEVQQGSTLTKAQIMAEKDDVKRQKLIEQNMKLFNK